MVDGAVWIRFLGCWNVLLYLCARQCRSAKQNCHLPPPPTWRETHLQLALLSCANDPVKTGPQISVRHYVEACAVPAPNGLHIAPRLMAERVVRHRAQHQRAKPAIG